MPGFELIGDEELDAIKNIFSESRGVMFGHGFDQLRNNRYRIREFEAQISTKLGVRHTQAVSSGTAALYVAMKCMDIGPGDEVITQSFTFVATVEAIFELGATPVVVEVDTSLNMCPNALKAAITPRTKLIMPVHMLGNPARMDEINSIAKSAGVPVIEDACEALGATYKGRSVGSLSRASCFSLDFGKTITCGEGGFISTDDEEFFQRMKEYHDHGHQNLVGVPRGLDTATRPGFNFRMSELQGAVASAQLKKLDFIVEANRRNKGLLKSYLKETVGKYIEFRDITDEKGELADTLMFFLPTKEAAARVVGFLAERKIGTKNVPDAMNWHFAKRWPQIWNGRSQYSTFDSKLWSQSESLLDRCISLPIMVKWEEARISEIAETVTQAIKKSV